MRRRKRLCHSPVQDSSKSEAVSSQTERCNQNVLITSVVVAVIMYIGFRFTYYLKQLHENEMFFSAIQVKYCNSRCNTLCAPHRGRAWTNSESNAQTPSYGFDWDRRHLSETNLLCVRQFHCVTIPWCPPRFSTWSSTFHHVYNPPKHLDFIIVFAS